MRPTTAELKNIIAIIKSETELFSKCFAKLFPYFPMRKLRTVKLLGHCHLQSTSKDKYRK